MAARGVWASISVPVACIGFFALRHHASLCVPTSLGCVSWASLNCGLQQETGVGGKKWCLLPWQPPFWEIKGTFLSPPKATAPRGISCFNYDSSLSLPCPFSPEGYKAFSCSLSLETQTCPVGFPWPSLPWQIVPSLKPFRLLLWVCFTFPWGPRICHDEFNCQSLISLLTDKTYFSTKDCISNSVLKLIVTRTDIYSAHPPGQTLLWHSPFKLMNHVKRPLEVRVLVRIH